MTDYSGRFVTPSTTGQKTSHSGSTLESISLVSSPRNIRQFSPDYGFGSPLHDCGSPAVRASEPGIRGDGWGEDPGHLLVNAKSPGMGYHSSTCFAYTDCFVEAARRHVKDSRTASSRNETKSGRHDHSIQFHLSPAPTASGGSGDHTSTPGTSINVNTQNPHVISSLNTLRTLRRKVHTTRHRITKRKNHMRAAEKSLFMKLALEQRGLEKELEDLDAEMAGLDGLEKEYVACMDELDGDKGIDVDAWLD